MKTFIIFIISVWSFCTNAQSVLVVGAGPQKEFNNGLDGLNLRAYYGPNKRLCFGPEFSIFPQQKIGETTSLQFSEVNLNSHIIFEISHSLELYTIVGANLTMEQEQVEFEKTQTNTFGFNYGLGFHYEIGKLLIFIETKGILGEPRNQFLATGLLLNILHKRKHHKQ